MAKMFFTSDQHFNHVAIIDHYRRPFKNIEEMNATIIERWNSTVGHNDIVYALGDFTWGGVAEAFETFNLLNGHIYIVEGNHDRQWWGKTAYYSASGYKVTPVGPQYIIKYRSNVFGPGKKNYITINHYAMRTWYKVHAGGLHLFGHSHGRLPPLGRSFDVGVDLWNFYPISLGAVEEYVWLLKADKQENFDIDEESSDDE